MTQMGRLYRDTITGFTGRSIGRCEYITGCNQVLLAPKVTADGALRESSWFDEQRLEADTTETDVISLNNGQTPGCDKAAPKI